VTPENEECETGKDEGLVEKGVEKKGEPPESSIKEAV